MTSGAIDGSELATCQVISKQHSVAYFLEPLLAAHNHHQFEIIGYANNQQVDDAATQRLRQLMDGWRAIAALSDDEVAKLIRQDQIDVLVDLAGHTRDHRLLVFARKPAPIQISYLGLSQHHRARNHGLSAQPMPGLILWGRQRHYTPSNWCAYRMVFCVINHRQKLLP